MNRPAELRRLRLGRSSVAPFCRPFAARITGGCVPGAPCGDARLRSDGPWGLTSGTGTLAVALIALLMAPATPAPAAALAPAGPGYAVVVSRDTAARPAWSKVVAALRGKYAATVIEFDKTVDESLPALQKARPRYVAFVATHPEATRTFVAQVHRLGRRIDDDPYADALWGIVTGHAAADALRIASCPAPLVVGRVASGTDVELDACQEGVWYCELVKNRMVRKTRGGEATPGQGPDDTTKALVDCLNVYKADLFVTSGHATERDWQIGYRYRNGQFRSKAGQLYGRDTAGKTYPIHSPNPKVYLPVGNCLMGHINGPDAMALAWMHSAGVNQMIGYTVSTWYGYAGWGCLDYFLEQPGRYTFAEAFHANGHALVHRLTTYFPQVAKVEDGLSRRPATLPTLTPEARAAGLRTQDALGLLFDRDAVAFYGDPAWSARMAPGPLAWKQALSVDGEVYTFRIEPQRGAKTFQPINTNGSQRGGRPIVCYLPSRIGPAKVLEGADLNPVVTDDFLLIPNPKTCDPGRTYQVKFQAKRVK